MGKLITKITDYATSFMDAMGVHEVTFELIELGIVKEIEPLYMAPKCATGYRYVKFQGRHIYISRKIRIIGPLILTTEWVWKKKLFLSGATLPI